MSNFDNISLPAALKEKVFRNDPSCNKELEELSSLFIKREFPRKKTLVAAGEKWDKIYFIHQGIIRLFYTDKEGKEFNKGFFHEGLFAWPVAPSARKMTACSVSPRLEDVKISVCHFESFFSYLSDHGYWEKFALPYAELFAEEKFFREYEFLTTSATERFQKFCIDNPVLSERIPDYHLATYLGITNVSLSRIKKRINF